MTLSRVLVGELLSGTVDLFCVGVGERLSMVLLDLLFSGVLESFGVDVGM